MKKTMTLLFLLAAAAGFYALAVNAKGQGSEPTPTAAAKPSPAPTLTLTAPVCVVRTGVEGGRVNLRACPGAACGAALDILTEGESLTILFTAGEYMNVKTEDGAAGWLNKKYCKGE